MLFEISFVVTMTKHFEKYRRIAWNYTFLVFSFSKMVKFLQFNSLIRKSGGVSGKWIFVLLLLVSINQCLNRQRKKCQKGDPKV